MEKKENASKLISSLVALSLATTLGVPTIALADQGQDATPQPAAQQQAAEGASENGPAPLGASETPTAQQSENASTLPTAAADGVITIAESGTYSISENTTASIVVNEDIKVTLNITSGTKLTNADGKHTITNNGTLTITGEGTVDNVSHGRAAIENAIGASVTIKGCTFKRSMEKGTYEPHEHGGNNGGNSYYTIENEGNMTIESPAKVLNDGGYSSNIRNGGDDKIASSNVKTAQLTINGGEFSGGVNTVKNDSYGVLTINDGKFNNTAQYVVMNWNEATIKGGTFETLASASATLFSSAYGKGANEGTAGKLSVENGTFRNTSESQKCIRDHYDANNKGTVTVTGGTFTDPGVYQYAISGEVDVNLANDYIGDVVVPKGVTSTLNLNGYKITNCADNTISNRGILTIDGAGIVDNITHGKAAIYNTGTATLKSGTYERSAEAGASATDNGGNSFYTVLNHGTMTVEKDSVVKNSGRFSSLFENGYYNYQDADGIANPSLTINGGTFDGGLNTIKNDDDSLLTIKDGTFKNYMQAAFQNHGTASVLGGEFSAGAKYAIDNCGCDAIHDPGKLTISGGTFAGELYVRNSYSDVSVSGGVFNGKITLTDGRLSITGGTFSSKPDASYIASGYEAVGSDTYTVQRISSSTPAPAPTTETTTTTNPDGTTTTTVTDKKTGESTSTTEGANGTTVVEKTDASGNTTTKVTVPEGAATNAGAPVEIPAAVEVTKGKEVSISAPAGTIVAIPAAADAGNVAVIVHADGTETVIPMSLVEGGKAIVKLDGDETVKIVDNAKDFSDVPAEHWAADDIDFASSHEIFKGIDNGDTYEPETALTRNMMMTVLARTDGADTSDSDPWYAKGQQWAVDNGVSNGLWGEDSITREQLVTMLFNYANKSGMDTSARADLSGMKNADAVSDWALEAAQWAVAEGILKGVDNTDLAPQGLATRAQAAAFMQRYVKTALL